MSSNSATISEVFQQYLKEFSIDDFPTGSGAWRNELAWQSDLLVDDELSENADLFTIEELKEFLKNQPFQKPTDWSKDAHKLQNASIENPNKVNIKTIKKCFKHLRIINRNITSIDEGVQEFSSLTDLIVSGNFIKDVNSKILPRSLKVLELCGNGISDISCLCLDPPPLQHLGLSYNELFSISEYIKPSSWSSLLSLDLSFNILDDLYETVSKLSMLPKLRNLLLQGNPLFFFPGYRGFTIDYIKSLNVLDDNRISADERHLFKGMSKLRDLKFDQFALAIKINNLRGLRKPDENESVVEDFPRVILTYHIELDFINGYEIEDEPTSVDGKPATKEESDTASCGITVETEVDSKTEGRECWSDQQCNVVKTNEFKHGEEESIPVDFSKLIHSKNTKDFHAYLTTSQVGMRIVENRVVVSNEPKPATADGKATNLLKDIPKDKQNIKSRSKASATKKEEKEKPKAKVNKKQQDVELFEWSRTSNVLGTTNIDCQPLLLEESTSLNIECAFRRLQSEPNFQRTSSPPSSLGDSISKKGGGALEPKKKPMKDARRASSRSVSAMRASRMKTHKGDTSQAFDAKRGSTGELVEVPLRLNLNMNLLRWTTAKEGLLWSQNRHTK